MNTEYEEEIQKLANIVSARTIEIENTQIEHKVRRVVQELGEANIYTENDLSIRWQPKIKDSGDEKGCPENLEVFIIGSLHFQVYEGVIEHYYPGEWTYTIERIYESLERKDKQNKINEARRTVGSLKSKIRNLGLNLEDIQEPLILGEKSMTIKLTEQTIELNNGITLKFSKTDAYSGILEVKGEGIEETHFWKEKEGKVVYDGGDTKMNQNENV